MLLFREGHIVLHIYTELKYVAIDIFLCQEHAEPERIAQAMRNFFKPDKIKSTLLKRGSFGTPKELRPKVKTRVAPLRKIHNTGAKVLRVLAAGIGISLASAVRRSAPSSSSYFTTYRPSSSTIMR